MRSNKHTTMPSRHAISAFTFIILLPLVYYIPPWLMQNVSENHLLVTVLALIIIVPVMSYVALPIFFKSFESLMS